MSGQESMCGGSNPLKAFQDQAGRDRSLHQDRAVNNGASSSTFRSGPVQPTFAGDQAFANFQAGVANMPTLPVQITGPMQGPSFNFGGPAQRNMPAAAPAAPVSANWADEFRLFHANNGASIAPANVSHGPFPAPAAGFVTAPFPAMGMHNTAAHGHQMYQPHALAVPAQAQAALPVAADTQEEHPLVSDAFTAMFARLEADAVQTAADRLIDVNDVDAAVEHLQKHADSFEQDMDNWMSQHGPGPQERAAALDMEAEQEMENMADEIDTAQLNDLRRTAQEIVGRIGDSPRYQQSAFLNLMRNIMEGNVTVDAAQEGFVNTADHQPYTGHLDDAAAAAAVHTGDDYTTNYGQNQQDEHH